jgi:hypothetical protein
MELRDTSTERFDIGRAAIFRFAPDGGVGVAADGTWDGTTPLFAGMEHIGTTEGEIDIDSSPEFSDLTIELTGPAILKRYLSGESPSFEIGMYPDPEKMSVFSPSGMASAGTKRRRLVKSHTLWIAPEQLFLDADQNEVPVTYAAGAFLKDGVALTDEEQALADMSILVWKAQFGRLTPRYNYDDGGKSLKTVPVNILQDMTKPDHAQLYMVLAEITEFGDLDFTPTPPSP